MQLFYALAILLLLFEYFFIVNPMKKIHKDWDKPAKILIIMLIVSLLGMIASIVVNTVPVLVLLLFLGVWLISVLPTPIEPPSKSWSRKIIIFCHASWQKFFYKQFFSTNSQFTTSQNFCTYSALRFW